MRPDLTINAGCRYDLQFLPDPIKTDTDNFAPRLGIVYAPGDRKTVDTRELRALLRSHSAACDFERTATRWFEVSGRAVVADATRRSCVSKRAGLQPATLPTKPNITRIDPNIETSYSQQANLQIERELPGNAIVSVGYLHLRARHVILSRNVNVPTVPASAGIPNLGRPDPNWGNISRFESSGNSSYDGMVVSFNKRAARWANVRVSYTLSKTIDDAGNFFFSSVQDNFNIRDDRGLSDNDQRHRLVVSGSLEAPQQAKPTVACVLRFSVRLHLHVRVAFAVQRAARNRSQSRHEQQRSAARRGTQHGTRV